MTEEWLAKFDKYVKSLKLVNQWRKMKDVDPIPVGEAVKGWVKNNPPPRPIDRPSVPKPPTVSGTGNITKKVNAAQDTYRALRRPKGIISLAALAAGGTISAAAIGSAVLAYVAEEAAMAAVCYTADAATVAFREADTPSTKAEARIKYNNFVNQQYKTVYFAKTGLLPRIPGEKDWVEATYGIRYDILK